MRRVVISIMFVMVISAVFGRSISSCYAGPGIPESDIPTDISDELKEAIVALYSPGEDKQVEALRQLGEMGKEAAPAEPFIISMRNDASWKVRAAVTKALGEIGSPGAVDALINALKDENENVQYNAAIALGKIKDPKATDSLFKALSSSSKYVREHSAEALGEIKEKEAAKYLLNLLKDAETDVRATAATALGKIGNKSAIKFLLPLLEDSKPSVRYAVAGALVELYDISEDLKEPVKNLYSTNRTERLKAAEDLAGIGSTEPKLVPFLCGLLGERGMLGKKAAEILAKIGDPALERINNKLKSDNATARANAILTLGQIGGRSIIKPLIEALDDNDKSVRSTAVKSLISIGQPAVGDLINSLKDKRVNIRAYAVEVLGEIKDTSSVGSLIKALADSDPDVRANVASALGKIKDLRAVDALITAIKDSSWKARMNAIEALGKIGSLRGAEPLIAAMKDIKTEVRIKIVDALGELKYDKAIEHLVGALNDTSRDVRLHSADALAKITGENFGRDISRWKKWREEYLLSKLLEYKVAIETKVMALELLQETKNPDYIETLFLVLRRNKLKPEILENAASALRKITGEDFGRDADAWERWWRNDLIAGLDDSDRSRRVRTAERLGELRNRVAIEPLIKKLRDTFADMREAAAESLRQITGQKLRADAASWEYWWDENKLKFQRSF